jgi:FkbH-like protein
MKIALLSNVTTDIIASLVGGNSEVYSPPGFNTWYQEVLDPGSGLHSFAPDVIVILIDANALLDGVIDSEGWAEALDAEIGKIREVAARFQDCCLIVSNIDIRPRKIIPLATTRCEPRLEADWISEIAEIASLHGHLCILDIKRIAEDIGRGKFYDDKMWYAGSIPYGIVGSRAIAHDVRRCAAAYFGKRKKCLVVDLDNTLWGGVIGEDGIDGIVLGQSKEGARFRDIQLRLREIKDTGVLLAVVSKNNEDDALNAIRNHPEMILREDDFVRIQANWNLKSDNIVELSRQLNIGIDAFAFLDDNPAERSEVQARLPEVAVIEPLHHLEIFESDVIGAYQDYFATLALTEEDRSKTEEYLSEKRRQELRAGTSSVEEYLASLGIKVALRHAGKSDIERVAQLTQKTNQYNLTTKRYSVADIAAMCEDSSYRVYVATASDKFGNSGIILVAIVRVKGTRAELDSFLMSCRVMGRRIEYAILGSIEKEMQVEGVTAIIGYYVRTTKNTPVERFLDMAGYRMTSECSDGSKTYCKEPIEPLAVPDFIKME